MPYLQAIPYRSKLTERISPGQTLIIKGKTHADAKRFAFYIYIYIYFLYKLNSFCLLYFRQ